MVWGGWGQLGRDLAKREGRALRMAEEREAVMMGMATTDSSKASRRHRMLYYQQRYQQHRLRMHSWPTRREAYFRLAKRTDEEVGLTPHGTTLCPCYSLIHHLPCRPLTCQEDRRGRSYCSHSNPPPASSPPSTLPLPFPPIPSLSR